MSIREKHVAEISNTNSNNALYFLVGGIAVVVGVLTFMFLNGMIGGHTSKMEVSIEARAKLRPRFFDFVALSAANRSTLRGTMLQFAEAIPHKRQQLNTGHCLSLKSDRP
jgi:hypothetical protein